MTAVFEAFPNVLSLVQKKSGHKHNYDDKIVVFNKAKLWGPMKVVWEKGCEADRILSHCSFDIHQCGTGAQINALSLTKFLTAVHHVPSTCLDCSDSADTW